MTTIHNKWRDRDIRIFDKHLKKYQGVNEILLVYQMFGAPIRVYFTDVGLFGGNIGGDYPKELSNDCKGQWCICSKSKIDWNNIESVEFKGLQEVKPFLRNNKYRVANLRFKKELKEKDLVIKQSYWYGSYSSLLQNGEFTLILPFGTSQLKKAREILEEKIKNV